MSSPSRLEGVHMGVAIFRFFANILNLLRKSFLNIFLMMSSNYSK